MSKSTLYTCTKCLGNRRVSYKGAAPLQPEDSEPTAGCEHEWITYFSHQILQEAMEDRALEEALQNRNASKAAKADKISELTNAGDGWVQALPKWDDYVYTYRFECPRCLQEIDGVGTEDPEATIVGHYYDECIRALATILSKVRISFD